MENKFPTQRWQRKAMEQGVQRLNVPKDPNSSGLLNLSNLSLNTPVLSASFNKSSPGRSPGRGCKTPGKNKSPSRSATTPGHGHTVLDGSLTLRPGGKTPTRNGARTPSGGDRFIPCRTATDLENSYQQLRGGSSSDSTLNTDEASGGGGSLQQHVSSEEQQQQLAETLNNGVPRDTRILCFRAKAPQPADGYANGLRVLYSACKSMAPRAPSTRHIPSMPERVLDAPDLLDDYYLHLLDWSQTNHLAAALGNAVYVWNANDSTTSSLTQLESQDDYVCSLSWVREGYVLAIGDSTGAVQLWDVSRQKRLRVMAGHSARVSTLSWNNHVVSSGSRSGEIHHHDVRVANHHVGTLTSHVQEVCGLRWSADGRLLASGGNDNQLLVWDAMAGMGNSSEPLHTFSHHQAAVKAVSWCPWSPHLLASGGGTADRTIRFFNASTGQLLNTTTTNSQVCALVWSSEYREIMSGHGFNYNQLTIWKYPQMTKVIDLTGHESRVLELTVSPDGSTVASAAADETIRLWQCWQSDKSKKPKSAGAQQTSRSTFLRNSIR